MRLLEIKPKLSYSVWYNEDVSVTNLLQKKLHWDSPGGPVVKNLPANAGDMGSIPGWGTKILQAGGQPRPHSATTALVLSTACTSQLEEP